MIRPHRSAVYFGLGFLVCGCASMVSTSYWDGETWDTNLFQAVQASLHYPADAPDQSIQSAHAKIEFTYLDGRARDAQIVESTGHPELDAAMLQQLQSASLPKATGPRAAEPHAFALNLDLPTPFQAFERAEYTAINAKWVYPKEAILSGAQGAALVSFTYLDGKVSDVGIARSSRDRSLDAASVDAVSSAEYPSPPPGFAGKPLHMTVLICYSLGSSNICPVTRYVVQVSN